MPTYVYRRADGTTFERFQRITEDALTEDPETGQPVTRVISGGVGVQFKGSGFYETDYVRKPSSASSTSDGAATGTESGTASASASSNDSATSSPDASDS